MHMQLDFLRQYSDEVLISSLRPQLKAAIDRLLDHGCSAGGILAVVEESCVAFGAKRKSLVYLACAAYLEQQTRALRVEADPQ